MFSEIGIAFSEIKFTYSEIQVIVSEIKMPFPKLNDFFRNLGWKGVVSSMKINLVDNST